jgi:iron complex transport system substrate-binding protein
MRLALLASSAVTLAASLVGTNQLPGTASLGDVDFGVAGVAPVTGTCPEPQRVVSAALLADELLAEFLPLDRFAAVSYVADWARVTGLPKPFPRAIPRTSGKAEDILLRAPDLVVVSDYNGGATIAQLASAGICVRRLAAPRTFRELLAAIEHLGVWTEQEGSARRFARALRLDIAAIEALRSSAPPLRALVLSGTQVYGAKTLQDSCLELGGFVNAAARDGISGTPMLTSEHIFALDPDVVFLGTDTVGARTARRDRLPLGVPWDVTRAGRHDRIFEVPAKWLGSLSHHALAACRAYAEATR